MKITHGIVYKPRWLAARLAAEDGMRTRVFGLLGLAGLAWLLVIGAAGAGAAEGGAAPGLVAAGKLSLGLETAWMAKENLADALEYGWDDGSPADSQISREVTLKGDRYYMARLAYGLHRRLTVSARAGMVEGGIWGETLANGRWEARLKSGFAWGLGARGLLWESAWGLGLSAGLDYLRWDDRGIKSWRTPDGGSTDDYVAGIGSDLDYWRIQAEVVAHWRLGRWTPYLGGAYAYSKFKSEDNWTWADGTQSHYRDDFSNNDRWGLVGGLQAELLPNLSLTLSGVAIMREELGLALTYQF